ncbi:MAG: hypothetical protein ACYC9Q_04975 [Bacillota bacterium]
MAMGRCTPEGTKVNDRMIQWKDTSVSDTNLQAYFYTYDAAGRLVEVYQDGGPNRERYVDYTYDGHGNRVGLVAHVEEPGENCKHLDWCKADKI